MNQLRMQRYFGVGSTAGRWLVPGTCLHLHRDRGLWELEASVWAWNDLTDLAQQRRAKRWLRTTGLGRARFPTRRAAMQELTRLNRQQPLSVSDRKP